LYFEIRENLLSFDSKIGDIEPTYGPSRKGDIPHSLASIEKAKNLLNYSPKYSLKEGLEDTVSWYWRNKID